MAMEAAPAASPPNSMRTRGPVRMTNVPKTNPIENPTKVPAARARLMSPRCQPRVLTKGSMNTLKE